jgi:hypothetical protein
MQYNALAPLAHAQSAGDGCDEQEHCGDDEDDPKMSHMQLHGPTPRLPGSAAARPLAAGVLFMSLRLCHDLEQSARVGDQ